MSYLKKLLLFTFITITIFCNLVLAADSLVLDAGLGVFSTEGYSISQVKFAKIALQEDLWYALKQRFSVGGWLDARGDGRQDSGFAGYQIGFEVANDVFESNIFAGPSAISTPDVALGGYLQFNESIFFGIKDKGGNSIGLDYNHFSSAGLEMPNLGRDFMALQIKFPF